MKQKVRPPKTNGFSQGLNYHQVLSYILLLTKIFLFQFLVISNIRMPFQIIIAALYYVSTSLAMVFGLLATLSDPTDDVVKLERAAKSQGKRKFFESSKYDFHCEICQASVSHQDTKHCRSCGRCVDQFDHHCEWVNNCISKKNYRQEELLKKCLLNRKFILLITSLCFSTIIFVIGSSLFLFDIYTAKIQIIDEPEIVKTELKGWEICLIATFAFINFVLTILILRLIFFHIYLFKHKLTTYEYIMKCREQNREKKSKKRSSLTLKKGVNQQKLSSHHDIEEAKNLSFDEPHGQKKPKHTDNLRLLDETQINKLRSISHNVNEEACSVSKDAKNGLHNSVSTNIMISLDKSSKNSERSEFSDTPKIQLIRDYNLSSDQKSDAYSKNSGYSEIINDHNQSSIEPKKDFNGTCSPAQAMPSLLQNFSSPSDGLLIGSSQQELQAHENDFKEYEENEQPHNAKNGSSEPRHGAFSLAKLADNYLPKYGKISEEDIESEHPNLSDATQDYESKAI